MKYLKSYELCTHTHTHTQPFYGSIDFVWDNLGELLPEETFTHSHLSWSSIVPSSIWYDPQHPPCSIHTPDSLFLQSLSKSSLVYLLAWHPPLYTPYISSPMLCVCVSGSLFLDGGIIVADRVFGDVLYRDTAQLLHVWTHLPQHPLQVTCTHIFISSARH